MTSPSSAPGATPSSPTSVVEPPGQLHQLARPFPKHLVHDNPGAGNRGQYVKHSTVVQRLLQIIGPFDFEIVEVLRGDTKDQANVVVGCLARMTVVIDNRMTVITEVGDCENPKNWPHDGARMKDAASDALKRCAARFGCGLHLWAQEDYYLYERFGGDGEG